MFPMAQVVAGIRHPVMPANGKEDGFHRIGGRTVILAGGVRLGHGAAPTVYGEAPTFPTAATVTGGRCGIPTPNGAARQAVGVIPDDPTRTSSYFGRACSFIRSGSIKNWFRFNLIASVIAKIMTMETRVYELAEAIA